MDRFSVFVDTVARYGRATADHAGFWLGASAVILVFALPPVLNQARKVSERWVIVTTLFVAVLALLNAWHLRWIGDDAFISFRYARNLVEGHGLVFNEGARVEGYTNFLWTMMLSVPIALGIHPGQASIVLSMVSLVATCVVAALLVRRHLPQGARWVGSIAALLLALNYTFASFGTSGLETMFASLMVLLAVERACAGKLLWSGAFGILATLAHPDHSIFYAMLAVLLAFRQGAVEFVKRALSEPGILRRDAAKWVREANGNLLGYALPFLFIYLPYFVWRTIYYGDLFPNTYYAKSGSGWYVSQGFDYLGISGLSAGIWATLPFACFGLWVHRRSLFAQFSFVCVPAYLVYVLKIGGDFMLGRLLCPVLPPLFIAAELGLMHLLGAPTLRRRVVGLSTIPVLALAGVPAVVMGPLEKYCHISDERTFYPLKSFAPVVVDSLYTRHAEALQKVAAIAKRPPVVGIGCVGIIGYETSLPTFDNWGLTEPSVAKKKLASRGRPGHEKKATLGHTIRGGADWSHISTFPKPYEQYTKAELSGMTYWLAKYDAALMNPLLRKRAIKAKNFEHYLSAWRPPPSPERLACDASFMSYFYFEPNQRARAERRGSRVRSALSRRLPPAFVDWVLWDTSPERAGYVELSRHSFDTVPDNWRRTGNAFEDPVVREARAAQGMVLGNSGAFLDSFQATAGDKALGRLSSPKFTLQGDAIALRVGGGFDPHRLRVRLEVDGDTIGSLTGCDTELMARWAWDVRKYRGKQAQIYIEDKSAKTWGHLLVDEIVEYGFAGTAARSQQASAAGDR